jgi:hypothetical protein
MRWKGPAAAAAGLLAAAAAIGWTWRLDVARVAAIRLLESGGFGPVGLTVGAIDLGGLHARDISLFGGGGRSLPPHAESLCPGRRNAILAC